MGTGTLDAHSTRKLAKGWWNSRSAILAPMTWANLKRGLASEQGMGLALPRQPRCESTRALASLALDSDISEVERLRLSTHLDECGECSRVIGTMAHLTREVRAAPQLTPRGTPRVSPVRRRPLPLARISAFACATLVAGLAGALLSSSLRSDAPVAAPPAQPVIKVAQLHLDQLHSGDLLFDRLAPDLRPSRAEQLREHLALV
jgi:hypothetical protein